MNKIYDNGRKLLGYVDDIIVDMKNNINNLEDEMKEEYQELLDDIIIARDKDNAKYIMIDYDNPMGYTFEYWQDEDEMIQNIKEVK